MRVRFEEPLRKRLGKKMALKSDGKGDVARDDSQFDGLQLVGTQKVGAHPAPVSRGPGRSFPPWNRLLKTGYIPDFSIV
jgi:hypothetical protein